MFGDKSNNIFWNMIKNKKTCVNPREIPNKEEFSTKKSFKRVNTLSMRTLSQYDSESMKISDMSADEDPIKIIDKLSTYAKICVLQGLLKEMKSIRERFKDNQQGMLEIIEKNCFNYYKSKIGIKEIFNYCESNRPEEHIDYVLIENCKEYLKEKYDDVFNFIFLLRNSNEIMLHIIRNCRSDSYEELSDIIVNLFYEDAINSTFNAEELLTLIYLITEELIMRTLPSSISVTNMNEIISDHLKNNILYSIFKSLTKKTDVRNFLCSVLTEVLLKIEGYRENITIEIKALLTEIKMKHRDSQILEQRNFQKFSSNNNNYKKCNSSIINTDINELAKKKNDPRTPSFDNVSLKSNLNSVSTFDDRNGSAVINKKLESQSYVNNELMSTGTYMSTLNDIDEEDENFEIDDSLNFDEIKLDNTSYESNSVNLDLLKKKLHEYEIRSKNKKDNAFSAMSDFINIQIKEISVDGDKFSNNKKIKSIKTFLKLKQQSDTDSLTEALDKNYFRITSFIDEFLDKLKDNITSLPYLIKSIMLIIEVLIEKKFSNKQKLTVYQKYMILSNFLIGNILLPIIINPDYTGIVTTDIISKVTKNNLNIIAKILKKILSGRLFDNNSECEYTIFNKFLIEVLQKIFEIIDSIPKNMKLPNSINKLVDNIFSSKRNINYNYFEQNKQENIQQQSACFSWFDLFFLSDSINRCRESLSDNVELRKNFPTFDKFVNLEKYFRERYFDCVKNYKNEFFYLSKINYNPTFNKKISAMTDENHGLFSNNKNKNNINNAKKIDEVLFFKKCLIEVLAYVNKLHKENFNYFVQKNKDRIIQDTDVIYALLKKMKQKEYNKTEFEGDKKISFAAEPVVKKKERNSIILKSGVDISGNEDADFKEILIPQIVDIAKTEIGNNLDSIRSKRVIFACSYLQVHIDDLPTKYKENNYSLLLIEIIKEIEAVILELKTNILNQYYLKVRGAEKLNMITTSNYLQIKCMEKCTCIHYLFTKLRLPCKLNIQKDQNDIITKVEYQPVDIKDSYVKSITSFLNIVPNFRKYEDKVPDIVDLEEKVEMDVALNNYFKDLRSLVKKEKIIQRFSRDEYDSMANELENYILFKLYDKLFPENSTKEDIKFYKKCVRLDWVKPENLIKDKKIINEKLWKTSMDLINEMDEKLTPADKLKCFGKAFSILQNSITFCSGKKDLGIDDTIPSLIYVMLKSKPKNIFSNSKYCQLLLNPDLSKKQFGILLSQIEMIKNIIFDMKHTDLIGVTEEQFKKGEEEEEKKESNN